MQLDSPRLGPGQWDPSHGPRCLQRAAAKVAECIPIECSPADFTSVCVCVCPSMSESTAMAYGHITATLPSHYRYITRSESIVMTCGDIAVTLP